jgi:hypothetical protein
LRASWKHLWRILPALLAFCLLAVQIAIPWTVPHFATTDGPSHLYTAVVAKKLLFREQPYTSLYRINPQVVPNWASTILLACCAWLVGVRHAEQLMMSLLLAIGFFSISYAIRALSPKVLPWTPLSNFLLQTWFLWMGFYNFYLGLVLVPVGIGFYARRNGKLTARDAVVLALGLVALFFVHLLAAAVLLLALAILMIWLHNVRPTLWDKSADPREGDRQALILLGAMTPVILLGLIYVHTTGNGVRFQPNVLQSWNDFPMYPFATAAGGAGSQTYLWPAVLGLIIIAALGMRRSEWHSAQGGLAIATVAVFLTYLMVPDIGLGGTQVKVRFAWAVFLLGGLLVSSVARLQPLRTPLALFVSACLAFNFFATEQIAAAYSQAAGDYLAALTGIRPGSTLIRLRYPTADIPERYGVNGVGRDPLLHLDAYTATQLGCIDLSDYQAPTAYFPVIFNSSVDHDKQYELLGLEDIDQKEGAVLEALRHDLAVPIDYAIVVADESSPAAPLAKVIAGGDSGMRLIAQSPAAPFVRVYQRIGAR